MLKYVEIYVIFSYYRCSTKHCNGTAFRLLFCTKKCKEKCDCFDMQKSTDHSSICLPNPELDQQLEFREFCKVEVQEKWWKIEDLYNLAAEK